MLNIEDAWGSHVSDFFDYAEEKEQLLWAYLFEKVIELTPRSYRKQVLPIIKKIREDKYRKQLHEWIEFVLLLPPKVKYIDSSYQDYQLEESQGYLLEAPNERIFGKLLRTLSFVADEQSNLYLSELILKTGQNKLGIGFESYFLAQSAIHTLADSADSISDLLRLQAELKDASLRKLIEKKLHQIAKRKKTSLVETLEKYFPDYGFENGYQDGEIELTNGDIFMYQMQVIENRVKLSWYNNEGKQLKTAPSALKKQCPQKIAVIKERAKNAQKLFTAQRERLQNMWMNEKTLTYSSWEENYASHGLLGTITENLIWQVKVNDMWKSVWSSFGRFVDSSKNPVEVTGSTSIRLWHKLYVEEEAKEEITFWKNFVNQKSIIQPFEQIHRHIFLLEDYRKDELGEEIYEFEKLELEQQKLRALAKSYNWKYKWLSFPKMERSFLTFALPDKVEVELWVNAKPSNPRLVVADNLKIHKKGMVMNFENLSKVVFSELMRSLELIIHVSKSA